MGVACTLALTQDRAFHLWVLSKLLPAMVKTASLALGEIPSAPEKGPKSPLYSCLSASIGCTPAARRAGIQLAAKATASKINTPPIIVAGSHG